MKQNMSYTGTTVRAKESAEPTKVTKYLEQVHIRYVGPAQTLKNTPPSGRDYRFTKGAFQVMHSVEDLEWFAKGYKNGRYFELFLRDAPITSASFPHLEAAIKETVAWAKAFGIKQG